LAVRRANLVFYIVASQPLTSQYATGHRVNVLYEALTITIQIQAVDCGNAKGKKDKTHEVIRMARIISTIIQE
jgi:hypothetical protein